MNHILYSLKTVYILFLFKVKPSLLHGRYLYCPGGIIGHGMSVFFPSRFVGRPVDTAINLRFFVRAAVCRMRKSVPEKPQNGNSQNEDFR
jgi:hypothetical protein